LIKGGIFIPLDDYIKNETEFNLEDFTKASLVSYQRDGKLWLVPYDEGPANLYYNKDLFDKGGVEYPNENWTLDDLKAAALKLTSGEGPNKIFGLGELPSMGDALVAPPYMMPFGGAYLQEPKEDVYLGNTPESIEAMQWWQELRDKGAVPSPADMQNVAWPAFQFGKIGMTQQGSWATPPIAAGSKFNWDIMLWPKGPKAHVTFSAGTATASPRIARILRLPGSTLTTTCPPPGNRICGASRVAAARRACRPGRRISTASSLRLEQNGWNMR
jgi:multiple sugar transport system substrate-binding protein